MNIPDRLLLTTLYLRKAWERDNKLLFMNQFERMPRDFNEAVDDNRETDEEIVETIMNGHL